MLCQRCRADSIQGRQRAQAERTMVGADGMQPFHGLNVYQPFRRGDLIFPSGRADHCRRQNFYFAQLLPSRAGTWSGVVGEA